MDNPLQNIDQTFEINLPEKQSLDEYLDEMLPGIRPLSEDLRETKFYAVEGGKPWLEIRDDPNAQEMVLHFFNEGGEYLKSIDGNVTRGRWRLLDQTNKIIIEQGGKSGGSQGGSGGKGGGKGGGSHGGQQGGGKSSGPAKSELYELAFLNAQFFILKKHGDQTRKGRRKYFMMGYEGTVRGLKWLDCVELLFNEYRNQWSAFNTIVVIAVVILVILFVLSYF